MDLPNHLELWDETLGRWWTPQGEVMPQKLRPQTPYISRNCKSLPRTLWPRVHPNVNESKAKSGVWGVKIIHKEAQGTHPWSPQRNLERNAFKLTNRSMNEDPKKRLRKSPKRENGRDTIKPWGTTPNPLYIPKRFIQDLACYPIILPSHKISPWSSQASLMESLGKIGRENSKSKWTRVSRDGCHPFSSKFIWRQPKD
jgi:hypothetical protein